MRVLFPPALGPAPQAANSPTLSVFSLSKVIALNDGLSTRPVSDLLENQAAVAYLGVLTILFSFLAYLALADQQAKQRRADGIDQMRSIADQMREDGAVDEANVIEREARLMEKEQTTRPQKDPSFGLGSRFEQILAGTSPDVADDSNRFDRRRGGDVADIPDRKKRRGRARRGRASARPSRDARGIGTE